MLMNHKVELADAYKKSSHYPAYRVIAVDDEGLRYVTEFRGPDALKRAREYADEQNSWQNMIS